MLVSIYRVETARGGCGPYVAEYEDVFGNMFAKHRAGRHPSPIQDELLGWIDPEEHCGFATRDQMEQWFAGFLRLLHVQNFVGARYAVPLHTVRYGRTQAVFRRGDHFPVESFRLN